MHQRIAKSIGVTVFVGFVTVILFSGYFTSENSVVFFNCDYTKNGSSYQSSGAVVDCVTHTPIRLYSLLPDQTIKPSNHSILAVSVDETDDARQKSFEDIFGKKVWLTNQLKTSGQGTVQSSGPGSTLDATVNAMATLTSIVNEIKKSFGLKRVSILDAPCGDMMWMNHWLQTRDDVDYYGADIVAPLIESHTKMYGKFNWKFIHHDVVAKPLPRAFDLIHSRHMMQHLTTAETQRVLKHFSESGSKFLLMSTYPATISNVDLAANTVNNAETGRFRTLNMELLPFALQPPVCMHRDAGNPPDYCLHGLWTLPLMSIDNCKLKKQPHATINKLVIHSCA